MFSDITPGQLLEKMKWTKKQRMHEIVWDITSSEFNDTKFKIRGHDRKYITTV